MTFVSLIILKLQSQDGFDGSGVDLSGLQKSALLLRVVCYKLDIEGLFSYDNAKFVELTSSFLALANNGLCQARRPRKIL